jgi:hypothetical protein
MNTKYVNIKYFVHSPFLEAPNKTTLMQYYNTISTVHTIRNWELGSKIWEEYGTRTYLYWHYSLQANIHETDEYVISSSDLQLTPHPPKFRDYNCNQNECCDLSKLPNLKSQTKQRAT